MARPRRLVRTLAGLAGIAAVACAPALWARVVSAPHLSDVAHAPTNDVALVLGAKVNPDGPSLFLAGRLQVAKELFDAGRVRVILVSGDNGQAHYNEPDAMKRWLVEHGVPADKIVEDFAGFDTYDSCVRAKEIFGVTKLTVVSQTYHLPRAVATCRSVGVDAVGVGDTSVRRPFLGTWYYGEAREIPAAWKMAADVLTRRKPTLGPREPSVERALR